MVHFEQPWIYQKWCQNIALEVQNLQLCSLSLSSCSTAVSLLWGCIFPCDTKESCGVLVAELGQVSPWPCNQPDCARLLTLQVQRESAGCIFCFRHRHTTDTTSLSTQMRSRPKKSSSVGSTAWGRVAERETVYLGVDRYCCVYCYSCENCFCFSVSKERNTHFYMIFTIIRMDTFPSVLVQHLRRKSFT